MCIIAAKPAFTKMPKDEYIENMFFANPDGAGLMWAENKQVYIEKGFMDYWAFKDRLDELKQTHDFTRLPVVMHFRITTHGGTKKENCHPFPVSDSVGMLKKTKCTTKLGVAHNGIIKVTPEEGISDTMEYIARQLAPLRRAAPWFYKNEHILRMIKEATKSRLAFLDHKGVITTVGDFVEEDGIMYSNTSYKDSLKYWRGQCAMTVYDSKTSKWTKWDGWESEEDGFEYHQRNLMWLDDGEMAIDADGDEILDAAIDTHGDVYTYEDSIGAMVFIPYACAYDKNGKPLVFRPESYLTNVELVAEFY